MAASKKKKEHTNLVPITPPEKATINVLFGITGSGKTSLIRMCSGLSPELPQFASATTETSFYEIQGKYVLDTAGLMDNRESQDREKLFNNVIQSINKGKYAVGNVFYLMSSTERLPREAADWLADVLISFGRTGNIVCVLTKCDYKDPDMDDYESVVEDLHSIFGKEAAIITVGKDRVQRFIDLLTHNVSIPANHITPVESTHTLREKLQSIQGTLEAIEKLLKTVNCDPAAVSKKITELEGQLKQLEAQQNPCCPKEEIERAISEISEQKTLIDTNGKAYLNDTKTKDTIAAKLKKRTDVVEKILNVLQ